MTRAPPARRPRYNAVNGHPSCANAYVLDTRTWAWTKLKPKGAPPPPRVGHSLVALDAAAAGGSAPALVLFGGRGADENALGDLYVLAPKAA